MIKHNQALLNRLNALADFALVMVSYLLSAWFRLRVLTHDVVNIAQTGPMFLAAAVYAMGLLAALTLLGFYTITRLRRLAWKLGVLFLGLTVTVLIASALLYAFRLEDFSRATLLIFYVLTLALLGGKYIASRLVLDQLRAQGYNIRHEVVIGGGALARRYIEDVGNEPELGIAVDATLSPEDGAAIESALQGAGVDEAVIALEAEEYRHISGLIAACEKNGVKYLVIPFYNDLIPAHPVIEKVGRSKLIDMRANRLEDIRWAALKRGFDIAASGLGLIVLSPLLALIALGVKCSSPGPVLFR